MKKKISMLIALVLVFSLCLAPAAFATTRASDYISSTRASVTAKSNGVMSIGFHIVSTGADMDDIGASIIEVKDSSGNTVETFNFNDAGYEDMMGHDTWTYTGTVTFQGIIGEKYCAVVGFYCGDSKGGDADVYVTSYTTAKR